jgi:hypothetical protein
MCMLSRLTYVIPSRHDNRYVSVEKLDDCVNQTLWDFYMVADTST